MILSGYQYVFKISQLCTVLFRNDWVEYNKIFFFQDGNIAWSLGIGFLVLFYTEFNIENKTIGFADSIDLAVEFYFFKFYVV